MTMLVRAGSECEGRSQLVRTAVAAVICNRACGGLRGLARPG